MARQFVPKVITSNHLLEGDAIYLDAAGGWTGEFAKARLMLSDEEAQSALAIADRQRHLHVGAYLADAMIDADGVPRPLHYRERFRTRGPSNYPHGKQAEGRDVQL